MFHRTKNNPTSTSPYIYLIKWHEFDQLTSLFVLRTSILLYMEYGLLQFLFKAGKGFVRPQELVSKLKNNFVREVFTSNQLKNWILFTLS